MSSKDEWPAMWMSSLSPTGTWACKARATCLADVQSVVGCADAPAGEMADVQSVVGCADAPAGEKVMVN